MYKLIDTDNWIRTETFQYFKGHDFPFYNITTDIEISSLYHKCKDLQYSINHALHYCCLMAINRTEEFKIRFKEEEVIAFDHVQGAATILLDDGTLRFCMYEFEESFTSFQKNARLNEEAVKTTRRSDPRTAQLDVIHFSVIPWIRFSSISHARRYNKRESIPKITMGKFVKEQEGIKMPLSIEVNHCFVDGYHISLFLERLNAVLRSF